MKCLNAAERKKYVSNFIWTALCEHWRRKTGNSEIQNAGTKAVVCGFLVLSNIFANGEQNLAIFIRNNWHQAKPTYGPAFRLIVKKSSVVWEVHRATVEEEIARLIERAAEMGTSKAWLPKYATAVRNIWNSLSSAERDHIERETERRSREGLSLEMKAKYVVGNVFISNLFISIIYLAQES